MLNKGKHNIVDQHPEVVKELSELLDKYMREGRSTSGSIQKNEPEGWGMNKERKD